jgi:hypothetical protein
VNGSAVRHVRRRPLSRLGFGAATASQVAKPLHMGRGAEVFYFPVAGVRASLFTSTNVFQHACKTCDYKWGRSSHSSGKSAKAYTSPSASPTTPHYCHRSPRASTPLHDFAIARPLRLAGFAAWRALQRGSALQLRQHSGLDRIAAKPRLRSLRTRRHCRRGRHFKVAWLLSHGDDYGIGDRAFQNEAPLTERSAAWFLAARPKFTRRSGAFQNEAPSPGVRRRGCYSRVSMIWRTRFRNPYHSLKSLSFHLLG